MHATHLHISQMREMLGHVQLCMPCPDDITGLPCHPCRMRICAGATVVVGSVEDSLQVNCARGVKLVADVLVKDLDTKSEHFDLIALPVRLSQASYVSDSTP